MVGRKVKIELDEDVVLKINSMKKKVGESYSEILRRILKIG